MGVGRGDLRLSTDLKVNTGGGSLGIVDGLGTSLDIRAHAVVVAGSESGSVAQAVEGDSVVGSAEADSTRVTGKTALGDVVRSLGTNKESVTTEDGVGSECWSLQK